MNAKEFNEDLGKLLNRALIDGIAQGKMSAATAVGVLELDKTEFQDSIRLLSREQAQRLKPRIFLPPGNG